MSSALDRLQLSRRVEEASLNAWPALQQQLYDGWLLRFSRGFTKRANSVNPIYASDPAGTTDTQLATKIRHCENLYARENQPTVFRLTSLAGQKALETALKVRGYQRSGHSSVLLIDLADLGSAPSAPGRSVMLPALDQWLEIYSNLTDLPKPASALHRAILGGIYGQLALATRHQSAQPGIACGLGVLEAELLGLFDIYTHPSHRRQGQGRRLVWDLLSWGRAANASYGYLQVASDNRGAIALYEQLGFRELYQYWYRSSP